MKYLLTVPFVLLIAACCHQETVQCHDGLLPVGFRGFDKSELSTMHVSYLKKASPNRIVLNSYDIDSSQLYTESTGQYTGYLSPTDTADIEVYLPLLSRTYLITALEQKNKRQTEEIKVCHGLGDKLDLDCTNVFTSYALDGVAGSLDSSGATIAIRK